MRLNDDDQRRHWAYEDLKAWRLENTQKAWDSHGNDLIFPDDVCPQCGRTGLYWDNRTGQTHCMEFCGRTRIIEPYRLLTEIIQ